MTCWLFILFDISERKNGHKDKGFPHASAFSCPNAAAYHHDASPLRTVIYHVERLLDSPGACIDSES